MGRAQGIFTGYEGDEYCLPDSVRTEDVGEAFWSFVCESFAGFVVEVCALFSLRLIREMKSRSANQDNIMIATSILLHLSDYRTDIIHEPRAHNCKGSFGSCAQKIIDRAVEDAKGESELLNEKLKNNAMWRSYGDMTSKYNVLDKLFVMVAKLKHNTSCEEAGKVAEMLMQCGAQPGGRYALGKYKNKTVLHSLAKFRDEGVGIKIAEALLARIHEASIKEFLNVADDRGMTALHIASEKGNVRICELLVDRRASVTGQDRKGMTALHYALAGVIGNVGTEIAEVLIRKCDVQSIWEFVNVPDERGRTALHSASEKGNERICELLLHQGACVTFTEMEGKTALHYALEAGDDKVIAVGTEIAQALLRSCDEKSIYDFVNATDEKGRTALHIASEKGNTSMCGLLVERGALVNSQDKKDMTALHCAFIGETYKVNVAGTEIAQALLAGCDNRSKHTELVNAKDENGRTALHYASEIGDFHSCSLLVNAWSALVHEQDKKGMTALHCAFQGEVDKVKDVGIIIAEALLGSCDEQMKKELVTAKDETGRTALHYASQKGNAHICKMVVDSGASLTDQDKNGMTALHSALSGQNDKVEETKIVEALLDMCTDYIDCINIKDEEGNTALHAASKSGNTSVCKQLVNLGASVIAKDKKGMTALHYAFESEVDRIVVVGTDITTVLLDKCAKQRIEEFVNDTDERKRSALHSASEKGNVDACKLLIDHGALVNGVDNKGMTALHYAFEGGIDKVINVATDIAKTLLNSCDEQSISELINVVDERGRTALHAASEKGSAYICKLLVEKSASVNVQDNRYMTALHYAFKGGIGKGKDIDVMAEIARALLGKCNEESIREFVNAKNEKGRTALHYASKNGNAPICELLVKHGASTTVQDKNGMTALHFAFAVKIDEDKDVGLKIAELLVQSCDKQSIYHFVNATDQRQRRSALHIASEQRNARICRLLLDYGALVSLQDNMGFTALHLALEGGIDEVIDVLVESPRVTDTLNFKDRRGYTPVEITLANVDYKSTMKLLLKSENPTAFLEKVFANMNSQAMRRMLEKSKDSEASLDIEAYLDKAISFMDHKSIAKFVSMSKDPEAYFSKVNQEQLLRYSLQLGSVNIVDKLFKSEINPPAPESDEDGKTALHLAAMCDNESNAMEIISKKIDVKNREDQKKMVSKRDTNGKTVLHEAALKGHEMLCQGLLNINSELISMKDIKGRNALYDAVEGANKATTLYNRLLKAYLKKDTPEDDLVDIGGQSPVHLAASLGRIDVLKELLSKGKIRKGYLTRGDIFAQTALHKAIKHGHLDSVVILLKHGAHPLRERDCDGRTALHYAVQAETDQKQQLAEMLLRRCQSDDEKSLLLWASAAGLGTADQHLSNDDPLYKFLYSEKKKFKDQNLLRTAARLGDIEMAKEMISKGYQTGDIRDSTWTRDLPENQKKNVEEVLRKIDVIKEQGNDKPAISDSLGRLDYAQGLAALFMNPYIKPPIAVGITGSWGAGKSSLMLQTERILLTTAAEMILFPASNLSSTDLKLPATETCKLSRDSNKICEHIYRNINKFQTTAARMVLSSSSKLSSLYSNKRNKIRDHIYRQKKHENTNNFLILCDRLRSMVVRTRGKEISEKANSNLKDFLKEYDKPTYLKVFKALAAMNSRDMLEKNPSAEEKVPAVLTVQYNAWKYRNDTEALAGIAVEVTKELEGIMTKPQWLNTCWRNTWQKNKHALWIEIFFPSLLALVLAVSIAWIAWVLFDSDKLKEWGKAKYAWPPAALVLIVWTVTKSIMGVLKPVSTQLMHYVSFPDHSDKLGYQERVISDICFLKDELGKSAHWVFILLWLLITTLKVLWLLITLSWITLLFRHRNPENDIEAPNVTPALGSELRIIVFVDDLDRCQESVILQVLSAVNLVLAECKISVVIGMDKKLIKRAIIKKYKDINAGKSQEANEELAERYLEKIIQLPLDLPEPGEEESRTFLRGQLGVLDNKSIPSEKDDISSSNGGGERKGELQNTAGRDRSINMPPESGERSVTCLCRIITDESSSSNGDNERQCVVQNSAAIEHPVDMPPETKDMARQHERPVTVLCGCKMLPKRTVKANAREDPAQSDGEAGKEKPSQPIVAREMLFVRYSRGEEDAFLYFQALATGGRKHPRELKRLLNYHRLVWYIFSLSIEAKNFYGWQVELITWIFICWEWQECMNVVIKNWKDLEKEQKEIGKQFEKERAPSLLIIAKHLKNKRATHEHNENVSSEQLSNSMESKVDALENSLADLKREMKEFKKLVSDDLKKDMKQLSDELKEVIKEMKEQNAIKESGDNEEINESKMHIVGKESGKNEVMKEITEHNAKTEIGRNEDIKEIKVHVVNKESRKNRDRKSPHENWDGMISALEKYDVSMTGIQAFQKFRFYCIAGYLPLWQRH